MDIVLMIVYATIVLGFLVFIHEGGHYLAARAFGVRVTEFMLGLPGPSIGFTRAGTRFGVTAVPLGGYAKVCGMEAGEMSPHLEPVLAALYRRGTANMEDVAADCGITPDEAYDALDELAEWGSVVGPTKKDQYNTYRAPAVRLTKKQRAALAAAPAKGVGAGAEGVRAAAGAPAALAGAGMGGANVAAGAEGVRAAVGAGGSVPADDSTPAAPARMALANSPVPLRDYELGEPREVADAHALFESEYRQQYRSLPFWKRSVILVAGVAVNLLFAIALFIVWLSVIGMDVQTLHGRDRACDPEPSAGHPVRLHVHRRGRSGGRGAVQPGHGGTDGVGLGVHHRHRRHVQGLLRGGAGEHHAVLRHDFGVVWAS